MKRTFILKKTLLREDIEQTVARCIGHCTERQVTLKGSCTPVHIYDKIGECCLYKDCMEHMY